MAATSRGKQLTLTTGEAGLLLPRCKAATFLCFALIFSILAIEDTQRRPFSSPAVKTFLPFCLALPLSLRQRKNCLDVPSHLSRLKRRHPRPTQQPASWAPRWMGSCSQCCLGSTVGCTGADCSPLQKTGQHLKRGLLAPDNS